MAKLELEKYKPSDEVMSLSQQLESVVGHNPIGFAFQLANKINAISQWMEHPDVSKIVANLEGSQQGFKTDLQQEGKKYAPNIRNACVLEALTSGVRLNGNEFNIISGQMMIVQNGWRRLCKEMGHDVPGGFTPNCAYQMTSFDCHEVGEPKINGNMVTIPMEITYRWLVKETGKTMEGIFKKDITITAKSRDTVDAWIGKAERRILRSFFRLHSGVEVTDDDTTGEFTATNDVPPIGSVQKSSAPAAAPKVDAKKTSPKAQDAEFTAPKESTPAMASALASMAKKPEPSNEPPEFEFAPSDPEEAYELKVEEPIQINPNRPRTNF
jgi:hypothetical protein